MTSLILVGHGASRIKDAARPVQDLAAALVAQGGFSQVQAAFMKQEPRLAPVEQLSSAAVTVVVPVFAGSGWYTDTLIPREMGLDGAITRRCGRTVFYTAPVGTHPAIPALMAARAEAGAMAAGLDPAQAALVLIAHGSGRPGGAGRTPHAIATAIAAMGRFAQVSLGFLEQEPRAKDWRQWVGRREVVVLPLLVAQGLHARDDVPPLFGLAAGTMGVGECDGRRVVLVGGLGAEPALVHIVAAMAEGVLAI